MLNQHSAWELREGISVESWWGGGNTIFSNQKFHGRSRARLPKSPIHRSWIAPWNGLPAGPPGWAFQPQQNL